VGVGWGWGGGGGGGGGTHFIEATSYTKAGRSFSRTKHSDRVGVELVEKFL